MNGRTRQGGDSKVGSADGTGVPLRFTVTGRGGVPAAGVDAVSLNVTVDQGELPDVGGDYVTVDGCATPRPTASNLNFGQDQTVPNAVITPVSPSGEVYVYGYGTAHIGPGDPPARPKTIVASVWVPETRSWPCYLGFRGRARGRAVPLDRTTQQCPEILPWLVRLRFGTRS